MRRASYTPVGCWLIFQHDSRVIGSLDLEKSEVEILATVKVHRFQLQYYAISGRGRGLKLDITYYLRVFIGRSMALCSSSNSLARLVDSTIV